MISFRAATDITWDDIRVLAGTLDANGRLSQIVGPVLFTMTERNPNHIILEPTFRFTPDEAKNLMTALWEAGVRPAGVTSPSSEINRLEAHLTDMRRLVFDKPAGDSQ